MRKKIVWLAEVEKILLLALSVIALFQLVNSATHRAPSPDQNHDRRQEIRATSGQPTQKLPAGVELQPQQRRQQTISSQPAAVNPTKEDRGEESDTVSEGGPSTRSQLNRSPGNDKAHTDQVRDSHQAASASDDDHLDDHPAGSERATLATFRPDLASSSSSMSSILPADGDTDSDPDETSSPETDDRPSASSPADEDSEASPTSTTIAPEVLSVEPNGDEPRLASDSFEPIHVRPSRESSTLSPGPSLRPNKPRTFAEQPPRLNGQTMPPPPQGGRQVGAARRPDTSTQASFDLHMGADRMMISSPVPLSEHTAGPSRNVWANSGEENVPAASNDSPVQASGGRRRQDMSQSGGNSGQGWLPGSAERDPLSPESSMRGRAGLPLGPIASPTPSPVADAALETSAGICYTPIALIMVVLITISITLTCCLCVFLVIKHLKRYRFGKY